FTKEGAGTLALGGANTYLGTTTANAGWLKTTASEVFVDNGTMSVAATGTLDLNGNTETVGLLTGSGSITLGSGTLITNTTANWTYSGVISGTGGNFVKTGTGIGTLTANNTFSGSLFFNGGRINFNNNGAAGT